VRLPVDRNARLFGQLPDGFRKRKSIHFHDETDDMAAFSAPVTIENPFFGRDGERRRLLRMKRTKALKVLALPGQMHVPSDDFGDVRAKQYLIYDLLGNEALFHLHRPPCITRK